MKNKRWMKNLSIVVTLFIVVSMFSGCSAKEKYISSIVDEKIEKRYDKVVQQANEIIEAMNERKLTEEQITTLENLINDVKSSIEKIEVSDSELKKIHNNLQESVKLMENQVELDKQILTQAAGMKENDVEGKEKEYNVFVDKFNELSDQSNDNLEKCVAAYNSWRDALVEEN